MITADGKEYYFEINNNEATPEQSNSGNLKMQASFWEYTSPQNEHFLFDEEGRLSSQTEVSGAKWLFTYDGFKTVVKDEHGNSFSFTTRNSGPVLGQLQPVSLTTDALQIVYVYDSQERLTQLKKTQGGVQKTRIYHYDSSPGSRLLTGITDERGIRYATWTYDDQGRAISSEHAGGAEKVTVAYNADGSSTVTNALGKRTTYRFQTIQGIRRITAIEGEPSANCPNSNATFTYDDRGLVKTRTDNKGHVTTFDYNERGLEVSRTEAFGTPQARTVTTTWHPMLFLPLTVTETDRITTYKYDEQGHQLGLKVSDRE